MQVVPEEPQPVEHEDDDTDLVPMCDYSASRPDPAEEPASGSTAALPNSESAAEPVVLNGVHLVEAGHQRLALRNALVAGARGGLRLQMAHLTFGEHFAKTVVATAMARRTAELLASASSSSSSSSSSSLSSSSAIAASASSSSVIVDSSLSTAASSESSSLLTITGPPLEWHPAVYQPIDGDGTVVGRVLRVGFLGAFASPVTDFLANHLRHRDRRRVHYTLYSTDRVSFSDAPLVTSSYCDCWCRVGTVRCTLTLARRIRDDCIDILVDLCGYMDGNRLDVMVLRPAPVQVTWIGYPNTTGVPGIQYRITDALVDPVGTRQLHSEQLVRLPDQMPFLSYSQLASPDGGYLPAVAATPALARGHVTFGCFNNLVKVNRRVLRCWASVLMRLPGSRLLIKHLTTRRLAVRQHVLAELALLGVSRDRIDVRPPVATSDDHLAAYADVDIALDTFPYSGTTTTCEALAMGVPVVTLAPPADYDNHCHRVTASLLMRMPELLQRHPLIASSAAEYVDFAVRLAQLPPAELQQLRQSIRPMLAASPICDGAGAARAVESTWHTLWHRWRTQTSDPPCPPLPLEMAAACTAACTEPAASTDPVTSPSSKASMPSCRRRSSRANRAVQRRKQPVRWQRKSALLLPRRQSQRLLERHKSGVKVGCRL